jgi:hypothetical protein
MNLLRLACAGHAGGSCGEELIVRAGGPGTSPQYSNLVSFAKPGLGSGPLKGVGGRRRCSDEVDNEKDCRSE